MTYLVLDVGSSSVRGMLFDHFGQAIKGALVSRPYQFTVFPDGASTVDPEYLRGLVEACIDDLLQLPSARTIRAVGIATFVGNLLGTDEIANALSPIYTYADTRSRVYASELAKIADVEMMRQRTGVPFHPAYHPLKLYWLKLTQPQLFASVTRWMDFGGYLFAHWFGASVCSYSAASWGGLLNRRLFTWDGEWLALLGLSEARLPTLVDMGDFQYSLTPQYMARWKALRGVPFFPAVGDGAAANIGMGAVSPDVLGISVGTTAALRTLYPVSDRLPPISPALWNYALSKAHFVIGGATSEGGNIFHWLQQLFPSLDFDSAAQAISQRDADSHGLTFLPLLNGERSPNWRADAVGAVHGLRLSTTPVDILHAALEGVALRLAIIANNFPTAPEKVFIGGGAVISSPQWAQIICNALDRPLHLLAEGEATARGVALMLSHILDGTVLGSPEPNVAKILLPHPENALLLRRARERQIGLYSQLYPE